MTEILLRLINPEDRDRLTKIMSFVKPYWRKILVVFALAMTSTMLGLAYPLFVKFLIDRIFVGKDTRLLIIVIVAMFLVSIVRYVASAFSSYLNTWVTSRVLLDMRLNLFRHLHRIPLNFFSGARVGDIVARINGDIAEVQSIATGSLLSLAGSLITMIGTAAILIWLNWRLLLLSGILVPFSFLVLRYFRPKIRTMARKIRDLNADIASSIVETFSGVKFVRSYGLETFVARQFLRKNKDQIDQVLRFQIISELSEGLNGLLFATSSMIVLGVGGYMVMNGLMTIGGLIAFEVYQMRIFAPVQNMLSVYLRLQRGRASIDRIFEYLDIRIPSREVEEPVSLERIDGRIEFNGVSFAYNGDQEVLRDVNFLLEAGKRYALVGRSGAGKTTIADLMLRLYHPTKGRILVDGVELERVKQHDYIRQIAVVAQETYILHSSVLDNIAYGRRKVPKEEVLEAARMAFVDEFIPTLPDGYETVLGERGFRLSGGQRQRIAIARAILRSPRILILDEATSSLDWMADRWVQMAVKVLMEGRTTLIITHRLNMVQDVERIFVIESGRIVEEGTHQELMMKKGLYSVLQLGGEVPFAQGPELEKRGEFLSRFRKTYLEEAQSALDE